jgi:hypothetical protein
MRGESKIMRKNYKEGREGEGERKGRSGRGVWGEKGLRERGKR